MGSQALRSNDLSGSADQLKDGLLQAVTDIVTAGVPKNNFERAVYDSALAAGNSEEEIQIAASNKIPKITRQS